MAENSLGSIDILELMKLLPHRYPFLLLDRIVDVNGDDSATGIKNVTFNEPHFQGHFPGQPVMPGVLIVEAMAQVAGAISLKAAGSDKPSLVYFLTIDGAKFRKPVVPGDRLEIKVKKVKKRGNIVRFACEAFVESAMVAEAEIAAMLAPPGES
jgi:3-hydroxyacyl-[acyl-carrier-protein] dehydratase